MTSEFVPIRVVEIELAQPLIDLRAELPGRSSTLTPFLALVKLHGSPLGIIRVHPSEPILRADVLAKTIQTELGQAVAAHLQADGLPFVAPLSSNGLGTDRLYFANEDPFSDTAMVAWWNRIPHEYQQAVVDAPFASVIIATRNRSTQLVTALDSILAQTYSLFEVIVVDNAPTTDETQEIFQDRYSHLPHMKYIREDRPGLASAHNAGIVHAKGSILAFADDDLRVDRQWLSYLVSAFKSMDNVGCVTGLIMPAELETRAQVWIEQYGRFGKGLTTQIFDMAEYYRDNPLYPYAAGMFGSGANMAFSREAIESIGGFDTAMGAGTFARGGDDLAAFLDVILAGFRLIYEPAAIVWHHHRREYGALRPQIFGYGVGLSAYLTRAFMRYPHHAFNMLRKLPRGVKHMLGATSDKNAGKPADFPKELDRLERIGLLIGPCAYIRSRWETRAWSSLDAYRMEETPDTGQQPLTGCC